MAHRHQVNEKVDETQKAGNGGLCVQVAFWGAERKLSSDVFGAHWQTEEGLVVVAI